MSSPVYPSRALPISPPGASQFRPLSFAQETMLFWSKLTPGSAVYNVPIAFRVRGNLNRQALLDSIGMILSRHEVLRSSFFFRRGEPCVSVRAAAELSLELVDLSAVSAENKESAVQAAANAQCRRPFDLEHQPLLRVALLRISDEEQILILTMHHIAADGWSVGVLLNELKECYRAISQRTTPSLPSLRAQYADFARLQLELVQRPDSQRSILFWKDQLAAIPLDHDPVPLDHPRGSHQTFEGATLRSLLPATTLGELTQVGQLKRATAFMVMLAALDLLLFSRSGETDTVIGVPTANRNRAEFEHLIGCFINMVAVRTRLSENMTFLELLSKVRESSLAAFLHSEVPFSEVIRHLHPRRTSNRTPIFQVQLVFQSYPMPEMDWPGLNVRRFEVDTGTSKFDLSVLVEMKETGLEIGFEYNSGLFEQAAMQRLLDDYVGILLRVAKAPEAQLRDFSKQALVC